MKANPRMNRLRRRVAGLLLLLVVLAVGAQGCMAGKDSEERTASAENSGGDRAPMAPATPAVMSAPMELEEGGEAASSGEVARQGGLFWQGHGGTVDATPQGQAVEAPEAPEARRVIYRAGMTLATHAVDATLSRARALVESVGGFVASSQLRRLVLRVPAERYRAVLDAMRELGEVRRLETTSQDVSEAYTAMRERVENLRALKARYEALLAAATTIEERVAIERELRRIATELREVEERLAYMRDQLRYSTITLDVVPFETATQVRDVAAQPFVFVRERGLSALMR